MKGRGRQTAEEAAFSNTGRLASMERPMKSALAYLLACRSLTSSPVDVDKSLRSLAAASDMDSLEVLVSAHAVKLAESMCEVRTHIINFFDRATAAAPVGQANVHTWKNAWGLQIHCNEMSLLDRLVVCH